MSKNHNIQQYEALLLTKSWDTLTPEERSLALRFGDLEDFENKQRMIKEARQMAAAPVDLSELSERLKLELPARSGNRFVSSLQIAATILLLMGLAGVIGYWVGRQSAPIQPIEIKEVASIDTIWLEKIVEKPVEVVRYRERPLPKVKQASKDSFAIASGRSLGESRELMKFVERSGM